MGLCDHRCTHLLLDSCCSSTSRLWLTSSPFDPLRTQHTTLSAAVAAAVVAAAAVAAAAGDVKSAITKGGGKPADSGSVMFNFMRQGQVLVAGADEDALFEAAIEAGADDVQPVFDEEGQPTSDFKVRVGQGRQGAAKGAKRAVWQQSYDAEAAGAGVCHSALQRVH